MSILVGIITIIIGVFFAFAGIVDLKRFIHSNHPIGKHVGVVAFACIAVMMGLMAIVNPCIGSLVGCLIAIMVVTLIAKFP